MEKENNKNRLTAKITAFIAASEIGQLKPGVVGKEYKCSGYFTTYCDLSSSRITPWLHAPGGAIRVTALRELLMMIDDDTLKQLLRINDGLFELCKQLTEKREIETSSRLTPLV